MMGSGPKPESPSILKGPQQLNLPVMPGVQSQPLGQIPQFNPVNLQMPQQQTNSGMNSALPMLLRLLQGGR